MYPVLSGGGLRTDPICEMCRTAKKGVSSQGGCAFPRAPHIVRYAATALCNKVSVPVSLILYTTPQP